jgi:hypothetical protein
MRLSTLTLGATLVLGACSGSGNLATESAGNGLYNATYTGAGTLQRTGGFVLGAQVVPLVQNTQVSLTLSQLGANYSGTMSNTPRNGAAYTGDVTGHLTTTGGTLTFVPKGCDGVLYGSFTLQGDGSLTGSLAGRDCLASAPGDNVHITFTGLVRP